MNQHLETVLNFIQQSKEISATEKNTISKAVKKADDELKHKNHELDIESSLERVRVVAMSMKQPGDMIEICRIISEQLQLLKIENIRNVQTAIINDEKGTYLNYEYFTQYNTTSILEIVTKLHPKIEEFVNEIKKSADAFFTTSFEGKSLKEWREYRSKTNQNADPILDKAKSLHYYFYSIGPGALGVSTYVPLSDEEINLFKRFRNVFELAYRRYTDIEKAQEQAREAQIELALERVRARTMAMQRSDELSETSLLLFQQFKDLGETSEQISIGIFNEDKNIMELYSTLYGSQWKEPARVDLDEPVVMKKIHAAWKEHKKSFVIDLAGRELLKYNAYRKKLSNLDFQEKRWVIHIAFFSKGVLTFSATNPHPNETVQLLERFASVFDGTYTRFLDLQKAEAQAREAQIEASLERVRAKAMAMHNSSHLTEAAGTVFTELNKLGINPIRSGFVLLTKDSRKAKLYPATSFDKEHTLSFTGEFEFIGHPIFEKQYESWQKKENYFPVLEGEVLKSYYKILSEELSVPYENFPTSKKQFGSFLPFTEGFLFTWSDEPYSEKEINILSRFKNILDLTIRRYLDLQKAEAQAREAKIEAALERVRSKAMAMHSSEDLAESIGVFYRELKLLSATPRRCGVALMDKETRMAELTSMNTTEQGDSIEIIGKIKMAGHPVLDDAFAHWLMQKEYHAVLRGNEIKEYYKVLKPQISYPDYPHDVVQYGYYFMFKEGDVYAWTEKKLDEDDLQIYRKFTTVLSLTYKRYKDLRQAEAQAREAQIEASLERVRSKAMSMQKSEDLANAVAIVFEELDKLNLGMLRCGIGITDKEKRTADLWTTTKSDKGMVVQVSGDESMDIHPLLRGEFDAWLKQEDYTYLLQGEDLNNFYTALATANYRLPDSQYIKKKTEGLQQYYYVVNFPAGGLYAFRETPFTAEAITVLRRFGDVFNLTYTRFNDLKQAEAQTREAKIESALERVRSKAMAMHKSDDLNDAVAIVFEELDKLNLGMLRCGIGILSKEKRCADVWTTTIAEEGHIAQVMGDESIDIHPLLQGAFDSWVRQKDFSYLLEGEDLNKYYNAVSKVNFKLPDSQSIIAVVEGLKQFYYVTAFEAGNLYAFRETPFSNEAKTVMKRFAGVFNLTYKRFLDIQKAEAQAVEAQFQKQLIEVKHREITENISYALRIQTAILPAEKLIKEYLQNSFVLYLPKDVVAGDFYWMLRLENMILFSANDCTGHGVSGAMVSVFCHNALNRAIREYNLTQPSLILDKVAELVEENFTQSEDKIQDGMDTSLCAYFPQQRKLQWAGANNPLWIVRNNELIEYKPDKQPIGKYENRKPYTNHEIELQQGDNIYIFSDGYQDQFGGERGKKLTKKGLKNILLSIHEKNMEAQYEALLNYHNEWKGKEEQVDDICLIGLRI